MLSTKRMSTVVFLAACFFSVAAQAVDEPNLPDDFPLFETLWTPEAAPGVFIGTIGNYNVILDTYGTGPKK